MKSIVLDPRLLTGEASALPGVLDSGVMVEGARSYPPGPRGPCLLLLLPSAPDPQFLIKHGSSGVDTPVGQSGEPREMAWCLLSSHVPVHTSNMALPSLPFRASQVLRTWRQRT